METDAFVETVMAKNSLDSMRDSDSHSDTVAQLKTHGGSLSSLFEEGIGAIFVKVGFSLASI